MYGQRVVRLPYSWDSPKLDDSQSHQKQAHNLSHSEPATYLMLFNTKWVNLCGPTRRPALMLCWLTLLSFLMYLCKFCAIAENLLLVCFILWSCSLNPQMEKQKILSLNEYASHIPHTLSVGISSITQKFGHSSNKPLRQTLFLS